MKNTCFCLLLLALLAACTETPRQGSDLAAPVQGLTLVTGEQPGWQYENLRLYPIVVSPDATVPPAHTAASLTTLGEGMELPGFRITERKKFGRTLDAYLNELTVQNRSADTIFLMSGDVVTGGNQDRVIAHDEIVLPGSLRNVEVFCVEPHRWSYYDTAASDNERQIAAFRGYYNVASPQVRQAVQTSRQDEVWAAVGRVTEANNASSPTGAYAALESENEQKARREAYLRFFDGKFADRPDVVGMVAVCNGVVCGVDIFGHPDLFRRQYPALLHGYAVEAATAAPRESADATAAARLAFKAVARLAAAGAKSDEEVGKFVVNGEWVHLYKK
jgi:hypothetical protein